MPIYELWCERCGGESDHIMSMSTCHEAEIKCPHCGEQLSIHHQRFWAKDVAIRGDTCAGCANFSEYFDEGLNEYVTSRDHRKEIMKKQGVVEYEPSPDLAESRYIRKSMKPGDREAVEAARKVGRDAQKKRVQQKVAEKIDKFAASMNK